MKRIVITLVAVLFILCMGTPSYATDPSSHEAATGSVYEFDGSIGPASGPGGYDSGFGINFGGGYNLKEIDENLQARVDLSFYQFNQSFSWGSGTYTRVPFIFSARYYVPIVENLRVFGQAGLEASVDSYENWANQRKNEVNVGIAPGVGGEFFVNPRVSVFALALEHLISDSYFSMHIGVAMYF